MKKFFSLIALSILLSANVLTPISYAHEIIQPSGIEDENTILQSDVDDELLLSDNSFSADNVDSLNVGETLGNEKVIFGSDSVCGNEIVEEGEDCNNCPADVGECTALCGNEIVEEGEDCNNCPADVGECKNIATLLPGNEFRFKIRDIMDYPDSGRSRDIKSIKKADNPLATLTSGNLISIEGSPDVYAWFDNTDNQGIIYYYTDADEIYLNENSANMFDGFDELQDISGLSGWNTSNVSNMSHMFYGNDSLTNISVLSGWNTSNVTDMESMFRGCRSLTDISALGNWNTNSVTSMARIFSACDALTNISALSGWNISNVTDMNHMFYGDDNLSDISGLSGWNTSNVTNMTQMFDGCNSLSDISALSNWNTSNVTIMAQMFDGCSSLSDTSALSGWNISNVTNMFAMFRNSSNLTNLSGLSGWNTSNVTNMYDTFYGCNSLSDISALSGWNTSNVTSMFRMFEGCSSLSDISALSNWNTNSVTDMGMMFEGCSSLSDISALSNWNTSNVTRMVYMFNGCSGLSDISALSNWNTSNVTDMGSMFNGCSSLSDISGLSGWNTNSVTDMRSIFKGCNNLSDISALSNWNTSNVTDMGSMFEGCSSLSDISGLSGWNTNSATDMGSMFNGCSSLSRIDLSNWNTSNVYHMGSMFEGCSNLEKIYASNNFTNKNIIYDTDMFSGDTKLVGGNGTPYDANHTDAEYARIDTAETPGYFTAKYTITFDSNRGTIIDSQKIVGGEKVTKPTDPKLPGYSFDGWYADEELSQEFNFNTTINNNTTLYAKWTYLGVIKDLNIYFIKDEETINHFTIMDRNLGASEVYNQDYENPNTGSYGYYYQRGNNYGFSNDVNSYTFSSKQVPYNTWSKYIPSKYASSSFVMGTQANFYNWMGGSTSTDNIWGGRSDNTTDKQGPCPTGYHVPSKAEWETISKYWYKEREWDVAYYSVDGGGKNFASVLLLPIAGYIAFESNTGEEPPVREHPGNWATYRASTNNYNSDSNPNNPDSEHDGDALTFGALNSYLSFNGRGRADGNSVRCFKDSVSPEITINQNGGKNAIIAIDGDKITTLSSPTRDDGKTFEGWYADQGFTQKIETGSTVPNELFAKWEGDETINGCIGMDQANVTASATQGVITLRWNAISGDTVQISIFDPNDMEYKDLGSVNMNTEEFDYTMQWDGIHNFILNNGCSDFHYQFDISMSELYSEEFLNAYNWAYSNGIISQSIYESRLFDLLTNEEFVDIMNNFTENLGITPDTNVSCTFSDRGTRTTPKQQTIINKFCQLGLMSSESDNISFEPEAYTIRTIFGTALSRALRGNQYEGGDPYYTNHLNALKAAGIINNIEEPESQREIKGYALLMLMRANEIYNEKATLVNNLTKSIVFPTNEVTKKVVFSGTYTAKENHTIHGISIENNDNNNNDTDTCYNDIIFYTYINGEQVESDNGNIVLNSCGGTHYTRFDENININKGESINIIIEGELNSALFEDTDKEANYSYKLTFYSTGGYEDNLVSENLSPIKIINTSALSILTGHQERTVYLKERNSTIAEFTIKPSAGNSSYLNKLVLEISQTEIEDDDIRLKIDGTEYESTLSNNGFITYQPDIEIPSEGVPAKITLKQEPEYDDFTIGINVKSINGETIDELFSKRFVSALVYISKQENKGDYTKFTLGVDKSNNNYSIASVCMLTGSNGAGTCLLGENYADGPFEDGYSFEVINANFSQSINHIDYHVTVDPENNIEAPISIEKEDYPDYFKIGSGESRKIFSKNNSQCIGMESANITHVVSGDTITLKWKAIDGDIVYVYIFDPETETYISLGTGRMSDEKFDYKIQRNGQQNFKLTNGCRDSYYRVDVSLPEQYSEELVSAYNRAYEKGIISETPINNAKLYDALTNLELADIMNKFAENVLGIQPNTSLSCTFNDTSSLTQDEQNIITKSCQLGLMPGDRSSLSFNANETSNRATFGSALSRALRGEQYEGGTPYYSGHLNALKAAGIINQIENPESTAQIKGYTLNTLKLSYNNSGNSQNYSGNSQTQTGENSGTNPGSSSTSGKPSGSSGGGGGGGGGTSKKTDKTNTSLTTENNGVIDNKGDKEENKAETQGQRITNKETPGERIPAQVFTFKSSKYNDGNPSDLLQNGYTREMNNAYQFARDNGITTTNSIENAKMNSPLTRIAMAKMLSNYAINILGKKPDSSKGIVKFNDVTDKQNSDYDNAVTLSYQLGIMGQNMKNNNFRPNDEVTRAEFVTALSRMLYNTEDGKLNTKYYEPHITKLYNEGIITNNNPNIKEKRGYVMLMLMRTVR